MGISLEHMDGSDSRSQIEKHPIEISNISASFELDGEFDIRRLANDLKNSEYDPDRHRSLIYRSPTVGNFTILLPRKGRVSIAGAKNGEEINEGIEEFTSELRKLGITAEFDDVKIENIVATGDIGSSIDLNAAVIHLGLESTEYEPEQFPGAIYRSDNGVVLIFSSGKVVITAVKTFDGVLQEYLAISNKLNEI
jgi:transcription initiation factor TFIID TATA-box-binding protein